MAVKVINRMPDFELYGKRYWVGERFRDCATGLFLTAGAMLQLRCVLATEFFLPLNQDLLQKQNCICEACDCTPTRVAHSRCYKSINFLCA